MGVLRLLLISFLTLASVSLRAATENELKAAYVLKFASFAAWPSDAAADSKAFVIGIAGSREVISEMERSVASTKIHGRPVVVRKVNSGSDAGGCQILYITAEGNTALLSAVRDLPVLTIGETERFRDSGGIIELKKSGTKLRFAINKSAALQARIELSAQLMRLAATDK